MSENPQKKSRIEKLDLNPETVADLTEGEAEQAKGGAVLQGPEASPNRGTASCRGSCDTCRECLPF